MEGRSESYREERRHEGVTLFAAPVLRPCGPGEGWRAAPPGPRRREGARRPPLVTTKPPPALPGTRATTPPGPRPGYSRQAVQQSARPKVSAPGCCLASGWIQQQARATAAPPAQAGLAPPRRRAVAMYAVRAPGPFGSTTGAWRRRAG